jgi:bis(5'-nucleosyl)-tetraphosphatase (symmetrical)
MRSLLEKVDFDASVDDLWFLGDLINRGPNNLETLRFIMSLGESANCVLGNHDLHFLAVASGAHKQVKHDTFDDVLEAADLSIIIDWMRHLPLLHYDKPRNLALVHAGLHPQWSVEYALDRAGEVQAILKGPDYKRFFKKMYGNKPARWREDLTGMKRLRVITNYFTRIRYCKKNGKLELEHKANVVPKDTIWSLGVSGRESERQESLCTGHRLCVGQEINCTSTR